MGQERLKRAPYKNVAFLTEHKCYNDFFIGFMSLPNQVMRFLN